MIIGIPKETCPGERRVALMPEALTALRSKGVEVLVESGAGTGSGIADAEYEKKGAAIAASRA